MPQLNNQTFLSNIVLVKHIVKATLSNTMLNENFLSFSQRNSDVEVSTSDFSSKDKGLVGQVLLSACTVLFP